MDIIMIPIFAFAIMGGAGYLIYLAMKKSHMLEEKRPIESHQDSQFVKAIQNLTQKIPGLSPEEQELSKENGTWFTTAEFPQTWEYLVNNLRDNPSIFRDPKYSWQRIEDNLPYKKITLKAKWEDRDPPLPTLPNAPQPPPPTTNTTTVVLMLTLKPIPTGGTAVDFSYDVRQFPYPRSLPPIVKETNRRLKHWCLLLSQNPNASGLF